MQFGKENFFADKMVVSGYENVISECYSDPECLLVLTFLNEIDSVQGVQI